MYEQWELDQELQGLRSIPSALSNNIEGLAGLGVSSWDFVSIPDHNAISIPSSYVIDSPGLGPGAAGVVELSLRQESIPSGYSGDYSNEVTTEHNTPSKDQSVEGQDEVGIGGAPHVIRTKRTLSTTRKDLRGKSHHTLSTTPYQLTSEHVTSHDSFSAFRNIRPRLEGSPFSHTEPEGQASSLFPRKGKRKPNTDAGRKKIKLVRRIGACIRCRIFKESCDENEPCGRCIVALAKAKVYQLPCYREPLDNVIAFRAGNARAGKMRSEPMSPRWFSDDTSPRTVTLSYPFKRRGVGDEITVTVQCRRFIPYEWDVMEEPWEVPTTGEVVSMKSPLFACYDPGASVGAIAHYIKATKAELLDESLDSVVDQLLQLTTAEATRQYSAVATAMNIRAASFFSHTKMIMTGADVLELPYFGDSRFLINGGYPVPGILDYQIDYLAIRYMLGQMESLVKQLKKLIFGKNQKKNWYEVYLTVFVLLQSLETVQARQIEILRRYKGRDPEAFARVRIVATTMMEEWEYSAKILIYHYRAVLKGMVPFAATWNDKHVAELRKECGLDPESLLYAHQMSDIIRYRADFLQQISKGNLDNASAKPLVWIAQLYVDDMS
ncbi:hypothetical protein QBC36DRAFT_350679 [Triangularia setosa]|uniref:Zn(2)-C6 fungal-type domain-containing protein n=1 Tax=Triangularia setosa TaxID=2587417 RepID=A0AAN6VXD5_9PEZI|nr:hypothetical protein QBC36DRAFT_350679 [Podospora setosa]